MSEMIRKQFYIQQRQQILLSRLASARGLSEAEVVRQAIEHAATGSSTLQAAQDREAWEHVLQMVSSRQVVISGEPYVWNREDAYEERSLLLE